VIHLGLDFLMKPIDFQDFEITIRKTWTSSANSALAIEYELGVRSALFMAVSRTLLRSAACTIKHPVPGTRPPPLRKTYRAVTLPIQRSRPFRAATNPSVSTPWTRAVLSHPPLVDTQPRRRYSVTTPKNIPKPLIR